MPTEKFGIETLKEVLVFGITVGNEISGDLKDKKFTITEILSLIPNLVQIPNLIAKKDAIIAEAKDLSLDEIRALAILAGGTIGNADVVVVIENGLNIVVSVKNLIDVFKPKSAPPTS